MRPSNAITHFGCGAAKSTAAVRLLIQDFPNIIIWHCLNHRLQLVLDDAIREINEISHFKIFLDKIFAIFHQSKKSQYELKQISDELCIEITKIGRVFGPRWASCSLRSAKAVWKAYSALYIYFSKKKKLSEMEQRLKNKAFLKDLALIIDILEELALLSDALQARQLSLTKADSLIKRTIIFFIQLKGSLGIHENKINEMIETDAFKCIDFQYNVRFKSLPRDKVIDCIIEKMKARLLNTNHIKYKKDFNDTQKFVELFNIMDTTSWNMEEMLLPWKGGEEKLLELNQFLKFEVNINDFRDYVQNYIQLKNVPDPEIIRKAKQIMNTIAISSAEAERIFSLMNIICTDRRASLTIKHIATFIIINLLGKPLSSWDPIPYAKSWLRNHRSAMDTRIRASKTKIYCENQEAIWKLM